jgi:hypothetical protein
MMKVAIEARRNMPYRRYHNAVMPWFVIAAMLIASASTSVWSQTRESTPEGLQLLHGASGAGWEILPDLTGTDAYKTTGRAIELEGGELQFAKDYLSGFELILWLADQLPGYPVTSTTPNVVRIEHGANATDFTLDPVAGLPLKSQSVSLADPNRPVPSEMRYEGWSEVSGIRFPTHRVNYQSGLKRGEVTTGDIHVNTGLRPQDLVAKPADFAPDIPRK